MKAIPATLSIFLALATQGAMAGAPGESPLMGDWILDVASLPMPPEARPRSALLSFRPAGPGRLQTRVEIVDQHGGKLHSASTLPLDGTLGRAVGTYWVDVLAARMPGPNVLVMQFVYEGIPRSTRIYSVDGDGKVLTETEAYFKQDGTPVMRTAFFHRTPGTP